MGITDWQTPAIRRRVTYVLLVLGLIWGIHLLLPNGVSVGSHAPAYDMYVHPRAELTFRAMAYYDEDIGQATETMAYITRSVPVGASMRRTIYVKGKMDSEKRLALGAMADRVVELSNVGREGETYLVSLPLELS